MACTCVVRDSCCVTSSRACFGDDLQGLSIAALRSCISFRCLVAAWDTSHRAWGRARCLLLLSLGHARNLRERCRNLGRVLAGGHVSCVERPCSGPCTQPLRDRASALQPPWGAWPTRATPMALPHPVSSPRHPTGAWRPSAADVCIAISLGTSQRFGPQIEGCVEKGGRL